MAAPQRSLRAWLIRDYVDVPPSRVAFSSPVSYEEARRFLWSKSKQPRFDPLVRDPDEQAAEGRQMSWFLDGPSTGQFYTAASSMDHGLGELWQRNWRPFRFTPRSRSPLDEYRWLTPEQRWGILSLPDGTHTIPATQTIGGKEYDAEIVVVKQQGKIGFFQRKPGEKDLQEIFGEGSERAAHLHAFVAGEKEDRVQELLERGFTMDDAEAIYRAEVEARWKSIMFSYAWSMRGASGMRIGPKPFYSGLLPAQPASRGGAPRTLPNQSKIPVLATEPGSSRGTGGQPGAMVRGTRLEQQPGGGVSVRPTPVLSAAPSERVAAPVNPVRPMGQNASALERSTWTTDPASVRLPGEPRVAAPSGQPVTSTASPPADLSGQRGFGAGVQFPAAPRGVPQIAPSPWSDRPPAIDPIVSDADVIAPGEQREELGPIGDPVDGIESVEFASLPPRVQRMTRLIREMYRRLPMHIDPRENKWVPRRGDYQADHFVPVTYILRRIIGKHIKDLTEDQITELLTYEGNFQPLPAALNQSKRGLLPSEWMTFRGKPIRPEYRSEARQLEIKIIKHLTKRMNDFLAERKKGQRGNKPKKK